MISHKHKFIFVHIPKTGGCSIESVFGVDAKFAGREVEDDERHRRLGEYRRRFPDEFGDYFKFAYVRNPWDMLVSRYFSHREKRQRKLGTIDERIASAETIKVASAREQAIAALVEKRAAIAAHPYFLPFGEWIEHTAEKWAGRKPNPLKRATHVPGGVQGQLIEGGLDMEGYYDFVGRFENINQDFAVVCDRIGISAELPHVNASWHAHYASHYDDRSRQLVATGLAHDIERFGYRFGD